ncbi:MAG: ferredoxin-NADP reductase [Patescibacteria group bacterium]|jgi:ferredoxin-NADP reductase
MAFEKFTGEVVNVVSETADVKIIKFTLEDVFDFKPGQFVNMYFEGGKGEEIKRSYSIANKVGDDLMLCIKIVPNGACSGRIDALEKGDVATLSGPFGRFVLKDVHTDSVIFAAGTGVAPFMSMIPTMLEEGEGNISLVVGYRNEGGLIYDKQFLELVNLYPDRFMYHVVLSRPEKEYSDVGHVQDFMDEFIPEGFAGNFYMCGLKAMVYDVREKLEAKGVAKEKIIFEKYD